jgi:hypothetical protein
MVSQAVAFEPNDGPGNVLLLDGVSQGGMDLGELAGLERGKGDGGGLRREREEHQGGGEAEGQSGEGESGGARGPDPIPRVHGGGTFREGDEKGKGFGFSAFIQPLAV